jgi:hypothetical protein
MCYFANLHSTQNQKMLKRVSKAARRKGSDARDRAVGKFLNEMVNSKVDKSDLESAELQHFWSLLLRGMEVKIPFQEGKRREQFSVFWLNGTNLYLRKSKQCFTDKRGITSKVQEKVAVKIPLKELQEVGFGGVDGPGTYETLAAEDQQSDTSGSLMNESPCLNKVSAASHRAVTVLIVSQTAVLVCEIERSQPNHGDRGDSAFS